MRMTADPDLSGLSTLSAHAKLRTQNHYRNNLLSLKQKVICFKYK